MVDVWDQNRGILEFPKKEIMKLSSLMNYVDNSVKPTVIEKDIKERWKEQKNGQFYSFLEKNKKIVSLVFSLSEKVMLNEPKTKYVALRIIHKYLEWQKKKCFDEGIKKETNIPLLTAVSLNISQKLFEKNQFSMSGILSITKVRKPTKSDIKRVKSFEMEIVESLEYKMTFETIIDMIEFYLSMFWINIKIKFNFYRKKIMKTVEAVIDFLYTNPKNYMYYPIDLLACSVIYSSFMLTILDERITLPSVLHWLVHISKLEENDIKRISNIQVTGMKQFILD